MTESKGWFINMNGRLLFVFSCCLFTCTIGCRQSNIKEFSNQDYSNEESLDWQSLRERLTGLSIEKIGPKELLSTMAIKPDVDSKEREDRIWLASREFDLKNSEFLDNVLPQCNFDSYQRVMVWLGPFEPSSRHVYVVGWINGIPEFFEGTYSCVN